MKSKGNKFTIIAFIIVLLVAGAWFIKSRQDVSATLNPNFDLSGLNTPTSVQQGEYPSVSLTVSNRLFTTGTMKVECGLYSESQMRSWGFIGSTYDIFGSTHYETSNCVTSETNVQTFSVTLNPAPLGNQLLIFNKIKAPTTSTSDKYYILCNSFNACYKDNPNTGLSDSVFNQVTLTGTQNSATCYDGIANQDEVDTDCGGNVCTARCYQGYKCVANSDCQSNVCDGGRCQASKIVAPTPTPSPNPSPVPPAPVVCSNPLGCTDPTMDENKSNVFRYMIFAAIVLLVIAGIWIAAKMK